MVFSTRTSIPKTQNQSEVRDPRELKNHPVNQTIYGDKDASGDPEFLKDVSARGIQQEIHITPTNIVIAGHRRRRAAITLGIPEVRVLVRHDLTEENDIIEALICSNQHVRERTTEQKAREFDHIRMIEIDRGKQRMGDGGKDTVKTAGLSIESRKSRNVAAKQVGLAPSTATKASEVVNAIDAAEESGDTGKASELRETLNKNVTEAHRQIQENTPAKPDQVVDANGVPVPKKAVAAFEALPRYTAIKSAISKIKKEIYDLSQTEPGALVRYSRIKIDLENVYRSVRFSTPYCVCPYCRGRPVLSRVATCDACKGIGWGGESLYDNAPEELK